MIKYKTLADGGFVAADTTTRRTCYAYPSSPNAVAAITRPDWVAGMMMASENRFVGGAFSRLDYDARNWQRIGGMA